MDETIYYCIWTREHERASLREGHTTIGLNTHVCVYVCVYMCVCVCVCVYMCVCVTELQLGLARKRLLPETAQSAPCSLCACASPRRCFCCQPQPQNILSSCWTKAPAGLHNYNLWGGKQVVGEMSHSGMSVVLFGIFLGRKLGGLPGSQG